MSVPVLDEVGAAPRRTVAREPGVLPAWPLVAMVVGFPVEWLLGATAFGSVLIAAVMIAFLQVRGRIRVTPGLVSWFVLIVWVVACAVGLQSVPQAVGYAQRLGDLIAAGVAGLYYMNARERITARNAVGALVALWVAIVLLGLAAMAVPDLRLTTPVSYLIPGNLKNNDLVYQLVYPPMAEVQQPWGAPVPFNRPAAPFPYANSWGAAYAILTPVVLAFLAMRPRRWMRRTLVVLLLASLAPAIQTSNRGMFLGLSIAVLYVVVRLTMRGRLFATMGTIIGVAAAGIYLVASGSLQGILARQEVSDSTGTRSSLYRATFDATLQSPFVGWASPQNDVTIGYALGTQGHAWALMYSYGFVGLGLFLLFLWGATIRTMAAPTIASLWLHSCLVMLLPLMWLYGLATMQTIAMVLIAAVLLRARAHDEVLR